MNTNDLVDFTIMNADDSNATNINGNVINPFGSAIDASTSTTDAPTPSTSSKRRHGADEKDAVPLEESQRRGFMHFAAHWKREYGKGMKVEEIVAEAEKVWDTLTDAERLEYRNSIKMRNLNMKDKMDNWKQAARNL